MRSELRFVMHVNDENEFAAEVLADESVFLIDGPRWKAPTPYTHRSLEGILGDYCIIWSTRDSSTLGARYVAACNDWYCDTEYATIQFLRSQAFSSMITEGRIAVSTAAANESQAEGVERRFKGLSRFIKKHYTNSVLQWCNPNLPFLPSGPGRSANPSKPDRLVWVGPHALQWLKEDTARCVKQFTSGAVEAHLVAS